MTSLGMRCEPPLAFREQLLHLVVADPVVLGVVQHRDQHIKMREERRQRLLSLQLERIVPAFAPIRKRGIERQPHRFHLVTKRLEEPSQKVLPAPAGQHGNLRLQVEDAIDRLRLVLAAPSERAGKTCDIATLRKDDAAYGRSFTYWSMIPPSPGPDWRTHETDRIDLDIETRRAGLIGGLGIKHPRLAKVQAELPHLLRVLVQQ